MFLSGRPGFCNFAEIIKNQRRGAGRLPPRAGAGPRRGPGGPEARKAAGAAGLILFIAAKSGTSAAQM